MNMLKGKRILCCVTGGIAAYKAAELVRMLGKEGAELRVAMTESAARFVCPLTFEALSGRPVMTDLFEKRREGQIIHIEAARWPNAIIVAPATANIIGKLAGGIADELVSTILMAACAPVVIAPAMNWTMYQNEFVQGNLEKLAGVSRFTVVPPEQGEMACGESGKGRLGKLEWIMDAATYAAREARDLSGETVLVTAGPTFEDLDPVRFIANRSSGKMGFAIAREARARGAKVILVAGPNQLLAPFDVEIVSVRNAKNMLDEVLKHFPAANVVIKAAAVADYRPARTQPNKIKKQQKGFKLTLDSTVDILKELGRRKKQGQFLVGFAAETNQVMESGREKLRAKNLDMIVVNDVSQEGAGFDADTNVVTIIDRKGHIESLTLKEKTEVAEILFDMIQKLRAVRGSERHSGTSAARRTSGRKASSRPRKKRS